MEVFTAADKAILDPLIPSGGRGKCHSQTPSVACEGLPIVLLRASSIGSVDMAYKEKGIAKLELYYMMSL